MSRKAVINTEWCKSCGICVLHCPRKALRIGSELNTRGYRYAVLEEDRCIGCGLCYNVCPDYAFRIVEEEG